MTNQRSSARYQCQVAVDLVVGDQPHTAIARNLSIGGIFLESDLKVSFGLRVQLRFTIPTQKEPIEAAGAVRWTDPGGFGVQFDGLRARDVWALGKYFETLSAAR